MADLLSEASDVSGAEEGEDEDVLTPAELISRLEEVRRLILQCSIKTILLYVMYMFLLISLLSTNEALFVK